MKITYYEYNSFIIEDGGKSVAIDPGATFLYHMQMRSVIPREVWPSVTHIFATHGDPDHYWYTDKVARSSGAPVIMNSNMLRQTPAGVRALGPRSKGLSFTWDVPRPISLDLGETRVVDGIEVTTVKATHGPLTLKIGPLRKTVSPGPTERVGWGSTGMVLRWNGRTVVNLGDTLLERDAWSGIDRPNVLMLPIGGGEIGNTMGVEDALKAVELISPKMVIPTHYNMRAFFRKDYGPADADAFRDGVTRLGFQCMLMSSGDSCQIA